MSDTASAPDLKALLLEVVIAGQALLGHDTVRIVHDIQDRRARLERAEQAVCDYAERLSRENQDFEGGLRQCGKEILRLNTELAASREECQRMRPVVEAAFREHSYASGIKPACRANLHKGEFVARKDCPICRALDAGESRGDNPQ